MTKANPVHWPERLGKRPGDYQVVKSLCGITNPDMYSFWPDELECDDCFERLRTRTKLPRGKVVIGLDRFAFLPIHYFVNVRVGGPFPADVAELDPETHPERWH